MKRLILFSILVLGVLISMAQNSTPTQAKNILKDRFISLEEAKPIFPELPENLDIPFSEEQLEENFFFWLVPVCFQEAPRYILIHPSYPLDTLIRNKEEMEKSDTLRINEARKILKLLANLRPNFPEPSNFRYLYRTKDPAPKKYGAKFYKSLTYDKDNILSLNLPEGVNHACTGSGLIWFIINNSLGFEDFSFSEEEETFCISTLIYLKGGP